MKKYSPEDSPTFSPAASSVLLDEEDSPSVAVGTAKSLITSLNAVGSVFWGLPLKRASDLVRNEWYEICGVKLIDEKIMVDSNTFQMFLPNRFTIVHMEEILSLLLEVMNQNKKLFFKIENDLTTISFDVHE